MDPNAGDMVREKLEAFLAYATTQDEPTDEGCELFDQLCQAVDDLGDVYQPIPKHLAEPAVEAARVRHGWDNWLVDLFYRWNWEDWDRQPGDKLTFGQKFTICGQIFTLLLVIGLSTWLIVWIGMHNDEWEIGRTP
jgi:hypothetical protein